MNEKIIKLKYPIPIPKEGGGSIDIYELKFGRFKSKHLRLLPDDFMEKGGDISPATLISLIASLADVPEASADEIDIEDLDVIGDILADFFLSPQETGKKLSGQ